MGTTDLSGGEGAEAAEARADSPGSDRLMLLCGYCGRNAVEDWVDVDDGLEMSCPSGGRLGSPTSSAAGAMLKAGRVRSICPGERRRSWRSPGKPPWRMGGSVNAVAAVEETTAPTSFPATLAGRDGGFVVVRDGDRGRIGRGTDAAAFGRKGTGKHVLWT
jgi:hypothetical protein